MRNSSKGDQKYFKSFASFRVFREIRVRARSLPLFPLSFHCESEFLLCTQWEIGTWIGTHIP